MARLILDRVRLFPLLIAFAFLALGGRLINVYTGFNLVTEPVVAQDEQGEDTSAPAAEAQQAENVTQSPTVSQTGTVNSFGIPSEGELALITQLRERREQLDVRAQKLDLQEQLLASTEQRISEKISRLEVLREQIKDQLRLFDEREAQQLASVVRVYETMKPKDAAPRFQVLADTIQLDLATRMKPSKIAAIMAAMDTGKAAQLTSQLATLAQPPGIADLNEN